MLYIVATPIGHLKDITLRALETLADVDYILAEDTRHSKGLLSHYKISKPLVSYHKFNEASRLDQIVEDLQNGKKIALISDAGSPLIADPGLRLTRRLQDENLPFTTIPGPSSPIAALQLSGFSCDCFQFRGFAPKKSGSLTTFLQEMASYKGISLFCETSERLISTLQMIDKLLPHNPLAVMREITKLHEEVKRGTAKELLKHFTHPKGEIIMAMAPLEHPEPVSLDDLEMLQEKGLSRRDAVKEMAKKSGMSKRELYKLANKTDGC